MKSMYEFLMEFVGGGTPCRDRLKRRYGTEMLDIALRERYIIQCGENDLHDPKYMITALGRKVRDE